MTNTSNQPDLIALAKDEVAAPIREPDSVNGFPGMQTSTRDRIRGFIVQNFLFGESAPFGDEQSLLDSRIVDSTGILELVGFIESSFAFSIADAELVPTNLDSVDNIVRFIERKTSG